MREPFPFDLVNSRHEWPAPRRIKRRVRKPSLRSVLRQAKAAGVEVARFEVSPGGGIVIVPGTPPALVTREITSHPDVNPWDEVLQ